MHHWTNIKGTHHNFEFAAHDWLPACLDGFLYVRRQIARWNGDKILLFMMYVPVLWIFSDFYKATLFLDFFVSGFFKDKLVLCD